MVKFFAFLLFLLFSILFFRESLIVNIWFTIIDENYFIPNESTYFNFKPIKMNKGSGDWWLYGEDNNNYYALNQDSINPKYFILKKSQTIHHFKKDDYRTWFEIEKDKQGNF